MCQRFATIIGSLGGEAGSIARAAAPQIFASFFPADTAPSPAAKPIASLLFLLIAMDEALSRTDLDLLAQLASIHIEQGLSSEDYITLIKDLEDVQKRIAPLRPTRRSRGTQGSNRRTAPHFPYKPQLDTRINWFSNIALRGVTPVSALCRA